MRGREMKTIMTEAQAKQILREHEDEDIPEELLAEIFTTLFDRAANAQDEEEGIGIVLLSSPGDRGYRLAPHGFLGGSQGLPCHTNPKR